MDEQECRDMSKDTGSSSNGDSQLSRASREQAATHSDSRTEWAFSKPLSGLDELDPTSLAAQLKARQRKSTAHPR